MNLKTAAAALLFPLGCLLAPLASAQEAAGASAAPSAPAGSARDWIELQKSGAAASAVARPLPGELADRSFQRYADSFSQPIPETLNREEFLSEGGGGK